MSILYLPGKKTKEKKKIYIYIYIYGRDFLEFFVCQPVVVKHELLSQG